MLDTDLLKSFIAVAESGSFTRAGEQIGRTQSAVSMQIKRLEDSIGKPLLRREKKNISLTPEGQILLDQGRRILRLSQETFNTLKVPELTGHMRLGIPDDYAEPWLPPLFRKLSADHPNVEFELFNATSIELVKMVKDGKADMAIVTCGTGGKDELIIRSEAVYWVKGKDANIDTVSPIPLALLGRECPWSQQMVSHLQRLGLSYRVAFNSTTYAGVVGSIVAGLAITILPISALKYGMEVIRPNSPIAPLPVTVGISLETRPNLPEHMRIIGNQIVSILCCHEPVHEVRDYQVIPRQNRWPIQQR